MERKKKGSLSGHKIVITRSKEQSKDFFRELTTRGAEVIIFPTIEIKPIDSEIFDLAIKKIESYDWILFTSSNAVNLFFKRFFEKQKTQRSLDNIKFAVIGSKTSEALSNYSFKSNIVPVKYVAESIIEEFSKTDINKKHFLLPRGLLARDIIPEYLSNNGAIVDSIAIYDTIIPDSVEVSLLADRLANGEISYLTFTSSSTVNNFYELLKTYSIEKLLARVKIISIGPITTETIRDTLNKEPVTAETHTVLGMIEAIVNSLQKSTFI